MYQLTDEQWIERIKTLYADHPSGLSRLFLLKILMLKYV